MKERHTLFMLLASWGAISSSMDDDIYTPTIRALRGWVDEPFIELANRMVGSPKLPVPVQEGLKNLAAFLQVEASRGVQLDGATRFLGHWTAGGGELGKSPTVGRFAEV